MNEPVRTEHLSPIEFNFYTLRQVVHRAKEAKQMGWTQPNDLYPYLIRRADALIEEIEQLIEEIECQRELKYTITHTLNRNWMYQRIMSL
jgi:hypothetical protein